jgi:hypothetical protein
MVVELDGEMADEIVLRSLHESILSARNMLKFYEEKTKNGHEGVAKDYFEDCLKEQKKDLKALKRVHNYFATPEEHID